uniref:MULE transposase domain-containing protein n=1 Tax=Lactuca sativa TaxID=4236 RepID=A0A9R1URK5_LACSA|nr:hypothetical protein LSAT_V11C800437780 [Lactuca sativa]
MWTVHHGIVARQTHDRTAPHNSRTICDRTRNKHHFITHYESLCQRDRQDSERGLQYNFLICDCEQWNEYWIMKKTKVEMNVKLRMGEMQPWKEMTLSLEGINMGNVDNWMVSHSESKNDLTQKMNLSKLSNFIQLKSIDNMKWLKHVQQFGIYAQTGCKWQPRASKRQRIGYFEITRYIGPHTCFQYRVTQDYPNLDANLIAQETEHLIKEQPSISVPNLRVEIVDKLGYTPSYRKVWVGKQKAIDHIFGKWEESYIVLQKFLAALQYSNPGTIVERCTARLTNTDQVESSNVDKVEFKRVFWDFAPSIHGYEHCRPVINIDATHLYGKYKGKMMIAMGVDGNNQIFPLAFAIVDNESYNSWYWIV